MDSNGQRPYDLVASSNGEHGVEERVSVEQLRHLVRLLDASDVSEVEVKRVDAGVRLVLRKAKAFDASSNGEAQIVAVAAEESVAAAAVDAKHTVTALLVGIFHTWAKPKGKPLISVGDRVKVGQVVGTIQSLNVFNDVEALVAGRVVEILAQDGQPVEYGQPLMVVDSTEEA
jgi:acetyl-CoA carboxylase biotin carboxyl carrier protein